MTATFAPVLRRFVDDGSLAGVVGLTADSQRVRSLDAVGFADIQRRVPMRPDTLFWIASMTKPITGTLVMMLVDEGKLRVDDPVEKYLPPFKDLWLAVERDERQVRLRRPGRPVTIRQVLSHTAGMEFCSPIETVIDKLPLCDSVVAYTLTPLTHEPGTFYRYSNMGINTAGRIIEVVSGQPYERFLHERLTGPLGMSDTTFWPSDEQLSRLAVMYRNAPGGGLEPTTIRKLTPPYGSRTRPPVPAGGLFSTAPDIARFARMILRGGELEGVRCLSPAAVKQMTSRQTAPELSVHYGLGWAGEGGAAGHSGAPGTNFLLDPAVDLLTVFLVQHEGGAGATEPCLLALRQAAAQSRRHGATAPQAAT